MKNRAHHFAEYPIDSNVQKIICTINNKVNLFAEEAKNVSS